MFANNALPRQPRSRLWTNRLWLLSGALGAATLGSAAAMVHDTGRKTAAPHQVAHPAAEQIAAAAGGRLEVLATQTSPPADPWDHVQARTAGSDLDALARAQADAEK